MKYFIYLLLFTLCACGSGEVLVTYETVNYDTMQTFCANNPKYPNGCDGWAIWNHETPQKTCTMYLLPFSEYVNERHYFIIRGHESKHCEVGDFH